MQINNRKCDDNWGREPARRASPNSFLCVSRYFYRWAVYLHLYVGNNSPTSCVWPISMLSCYDVFGSKPTSYGDGDDNYLRGDIVGISIMHVVSVQFDCLLDILWRLIHVKVQGISLHPFPFY